MMKSIVAGPGEVCLAPYIGAASVGDRMFCLHECPRRSDTFCVVHSAS